MTLVASSVDSAIGIYSGIALLFLFSVAAVCWGWSRAGGHLEMVLPLSHLWVHRRLYTPHKALFGTGELGVLWLSHLALLLLWIGTLGLLVLLVVVACYVPHGYAGASLFFVGVTIYTLLSSTANRAANAWEPLSATHDFYGLLAGVSFAGFAITQVAYLSLKTTFRGTGALYVAVSCLPLVLLDNNGREAHPPRPQRADSGDGEAALHSFLLDRAVLIHDLGDAYKHAFKARKSALRIMANFREEVRESFLSQRVLKVADSWLKDKLGVGLVYLATWLASFVPYAVWAARMVASGSAANACAAPLVLIATVVNELCLMSLDAEWNMLLIVFVSGRFVLVLSGSLYWLVGVTAVFLLSSSLLACSVLQRELFGHEDSVAAFESIVGAIREEASRAGGVDPSQVEVGEGAPAAVACGPGRRTFVEAGCLLVAQASIGVAIIVSYKSPMGAAVTHLSGAAQGGWAGVLWLSWATALGAVLLWLLLRRGSKAGRRGGKQGGFLNEYVAAAGQLVSTLASRPAEDEESGAGSPSQTREHSKLVAGVAASTYCLFLGTGVLAAHITINWAILVCLLVLPPAFTLWAIFASRWESRGALAPQVAFCKAYCAEVGGACPQSALLCCSDLPAAALADTPWPAILLVIVNALICIPLHYNYTIMYLCLWLLGIMAIHACCILWRTTVEMTTPLGGLVLCAQVPVAVWAVVSAVTGGQSLGTASIIMLFFAGAAVQLLTLSIAVYYDYVQLEMNKPEPIAAAGEGELTLAARARAALLRAASFADPTLVLAKVSFLASEACALVTAAIFASYFNLYLGIAAVICLALSLLAGAALLAEGPQRAARLLRNKRSELACFSVLFLACCGLFGAIADSGTTRKYLWVSLSWLSVASLFLGAGIETGLLAEKTCDPLSFFPVFALMADDRGVKDISQRAGGVVVFFAMAALWGVWSSVVVSPSDIGVIIYVTSLLAALLYVKLQRVAANLAMQSLSLGGSGGGAVLVAACKDALLALGGAADPGRTELTALDLVDAVRAASGARDRAVRSMWAALREGAAAGTLLYPVPFYVPLRRALRRCISKGAEAEAEEAPEALLDRCRAVDAEAALAWDKCAALRAFYARFRLTALRMSRARHRAKYAEIVDFLHRRSVTDKLMGDAAEEVTVADLEHMAPLRLAAVLRSFAAYEDALMQRRAAADAEDVKAKAAEQRRLEEQRRAAAAALVAQRAEEQLRKEAEAAREAARKAIAEAEERRRDEERARQEEELEQLRRAAAALAEGQEKQRREEELRQKQREAEAARQLQAQQEAEKQRQLAAEAALAAARPAADPLVGRYGAASALSLAAVVQASAAQAGPFVDAEFSGLQQMGSEELEAKVDVLRRLLEINPALPGQVDALALPRSRVSAEDIKQGQLGDCYFLSGLATMCVRPGLVSRMFVHSDPSRGLYAVRLFHNGSFKTVVLDDVVPTNRGRPIFASGVESSGSALWVVLLEKAYAKLHGSYANIEGGFVSQAMSDCTGGVPSSLALTDSTDLPRNWAEIVSHFRNGHLLGAGSSAGKDTDINSLGIVQGHAYSILDVQEVDGHQLLRARNPWGQREWTGRWSDKSDEWTPRLKKLLSYKDEDDGSFWICYQDFCRYFRVVYVCKVYDGWHTSSVSGEWSVARGTAGGCTNHRESFATNPQYLLQTSGSEAISIVLTQHDQLAPDGAALAESLPCGLYAVNARARLSKAPLQRDILGASAFSYTRDTALELDMRADCPVVIVPCAFDAGMENGFSVRVYSKDGGVSIVAL